jgi:hypothetical protein
MKRIMRNNKKVSATTKTKTVVGIPLTNANHEAFIKEYRTHHNATIAYQRIYKCAYETARHEGSSILKYHRIIHRIAELDEYDNALALQNSLERKSKYTQQLNKIAFHPNIEIRASDALNALRHIAEDEGWKVTDNSQNRNQLNVQMNFDNARDMTKEEWIEEYGKSHHVAKTNGVEHKQLENGHANGKQTQPNNSPTIRALTPEESLRLRSHHSNYKFGNTNGGQ